MITPRELRTLLREGDYEKIAALSRGAKAGKVIRRLVSLSYDKTDPISWRAILAIGRITADMSEDEGREVIQKVLWMMRDESGGNAWSGPEIIGEILRASPGRFSDIIPILFSFHEEPFFTPGVLWALGRLVHTRKDEVRHFAEEVMRFLDHEDAAVRAHAAFYLAQFPEHRDALVPLISDRQEVYFFDGKTILNCTIAELASRTH